MQKEFTTEEIVQMRYTPVNESRIYLQDLERVPKAHPSQELSESTQIPATDPAQASKHWAVLLLLLILQWANDSTTAAVNVRPRTARHLEVTEYNNSLDKH